MGRRWDGESSAMEIAERRGYAEPRAERIVDDDDAYLRRVEEQLAAEDAAAAAAKKAAEGSQ